MLAVLAGFVFMAATAELNASRADDSRRRGASDVRFRPTGPSLGEPWERILAARPDPRRGPSLALTPIVELGVAEAYSILVERLGHTNLPSLDAIENEGLGPRPPLAAALGRARRDAGRVWVVGRPRRHDIVSVGFLGCGVSRSVRLRRGVATFDHERDRPVVDELHAHVGSEDPGLDGRALASQVLDEPEVEPLGLFGRGGVGEAGPPPPSAVAEQREPG